MNGTFKSLVMVAGAMLAAQGANAQEGYAQPLPAPMFWQRHASTVQEGALRGWADVNRSIGEARYNTALALVHGQEAVRRGLENRKQAVQDYFELRQLNKDMRYQSADRPTQDELARANQARLPARLTSEQYKPAFGLLHWPPVLAGAEYAAERQRMDEVMADRSRENSGLGSDHYRQVHQLAGQIEAKLKGRLDELTMAESIAARKFLASLKYEAQFPLNVDIAGLAAR